MEPLPFFSLCEKNSQKRGSNTSGHLNKLVLLFTSWGFSAWDKTKASTDLESHDSLYPFRPPAQQIHFRELVVTRRSPTGLTEIPEISTGSTCRGRLCCSGLPVAASDVSPAWKRWVPRVCLHSRGCQFGGSTGRVDGIQRGIEESPFLSDGMCKSDGGFLMPTLLDVPASGYFCDFVSCEGRHRSTSTDSTPFFLGGKRW